MSNIFTGLKEVSEMNTPDTEEFNQLLNIRLAAELTRYHSAILATIMEDPNEALKETIKEELNTTDRGIFLEQDESKKLLRANILDKENNRTFFVDMTPIDDKKSEQITQQTYEALSEYVQDPILIMENVKENLQDNAI